MRRLIPSSALLLALAVLASGDAEVSAQKPVRPKPPDKVKPGQGDKGKPKPPDKAKPIRPTKPGQGDKGKGTFASALSIGLRPLFVDTFPQGSSVKAVAFATFKDVKGLARPMTPGQNVELLAERVTGTQKFEVVAKAKTNAQGQVTFEWKVGKNYPTGQHLIKARFPAQGKYRGSESMNLAVTIKRP